MSLPHRACSVVAWAVLTALLCLNAGWAQDAAGRLISACEDPNEFTCARTPLRPEFDFSAFELEAFAGARVRGESLRWHVRPAAAEQTTAALGFSRQIEAPVDAVSLHIKNPNAHDLGLRLEVIDADGVRYLSPTVELVEALGWRELVFDLRAMNEDRAARDAWPGLDLPIVWMQLVIGPLERGRPYTIYLDEISALHRPRPDVAVESLNVPPSVGPRERIPAGALLDFDAPAPADARVFFELQRDGATLARTQATLPGGATALSTQVRAEGLTVPAWLPPGRYQVALTSPDLSLIGPGAQPTPVAIAGPAPQAPTAALEIVQGQATLKLAGRTLPPVIAQVFGTDASVADARPQIIALPATTDSHPFGWTRDVYPAEAVLDFSGLDRGAAGLLNAAPDALLLIEVFLDSPRWWDEANPEQLIRFGGGSTAPLGMWGRRRTFPDLVSGRWAGGVRDRLRALVEHVEGSPYAHRVIGYELLAGDLGAWRPWGAELGLGDENTPLRLAAWRSFLVDKYHNFASLRDAWGLPPVASPAAPEVGSSEPQSWEQVVIPQRRPGLTYPALYDPASNGAWIDLNNFSAEAPARLIGRMAALVDEVAGGRRLIGACYGHTIAQSRGSWRWPHLGLGELLRGDALDLLTGPLYPPPTSATDRCFPTHSAAIAGKLWMERAIAGEGGNGPRTELRAPAPDPDPAADRMAVIIDDASARYLRHDGGLVWPLFGGQLHELADTGVPWRMYTLADLLAGEVPSARVYLFLDAFKVDYESRVRLVTDLCRDRKMLLWMYAPAAVDTHMLTGRTMKNLTGIKLSFTTTPGPLRVKVPAGSPLLDEHAAEGLSYGVGECFPLFFSADDKADRMGMLAGTDFVGLSVREYDNCISVHSAAPGVPAEVLRGLLRRAGLQEY